VGYVGFATLFLVGFMAFSLGSILVAVYSTLGRIWRMRRRITKKLKGSGIRLSRLKEDSDIVPQIVMRFSGKVPGGRVARVEGRIGIIGDREYLYATFYYAADSSLPEFEVLVSSGGGVFVAPSEVESSIRRELIESGEVREVLKEARLQYLRHRPERRSMDISANTIDLGAVLRLVDSILMRWD